MGLRPAAMSSDDHHKEPQVRCTIWTVAFLTAPWRERPTLKDLMLLWRNSQKALKVPKATGGLAGMKKRTSRPGTLLWIQKRQQRRLI